MQAKNLRRNALRKNHCSGVLADQPLSKGVMKYQQASGIEDDVQKIRLLQEGT